MSNHYEEKLEAKRERFLARAEAKEQESNRRFQSAHDRASIIPLGQPIHGSRDRKIREKISNQYDKSFELQKEADQLRERSATIGTGGISSDDPEAIDKLTTKLQKLEEWQVLMKKINAIVRKKTTKEAAKITQLKELGLSDKAIKATFEPDCFGYVGFAPYQLTNNSAEIRRLKKRIESLDNLRSLDDIETDYGHFIFKRDIEDNRYCFIFEGKPHQDVRTILKNNSFVWSPQREAWVRKISGSANYASKDVITLLQAYYNKE